MQREANNLTSKLHRQARWKIDLQHLYQLRAKEMSKIYCRELIFNEM